MRGLRGSHVTGIGLALIASTVVLASASASPSQRPPCSRGCAYEILVAAQVSTSEVTTKYSVRFPRVLIGWSQEPFVAVRPEAIGARAYSTTAGNVRGQMKATVDFHPTYLECAPWRKAYNVRADFELDADRIFYEPRRPPDGGPKFYGGLRMEANPPRELAPGRTCGDLDGPGIGWATSEGHLGRKLNSEMSISLRLGDSSCTSGVESLCTSWRMTYLKKQPITRLGFPLDRLWLGKGFKVTYQLRDVSPPNGWVRIEFLQRKR